MGFEQEAKPLAPMFPEGGDQEREQKKKPTDTPLKTDLKTPKQVNNTGVVDRAIDNTPIPKIRFVVPPPGYEMGYRESQLHVIQHCFETTEQEAVYFLEEIESIYGKVRWRSGWTNYTETEDHPGAFRWPVNWVERFTGVQYNLSTGKKEGHEIRKQLFLGLKGDKKREIWGRVDGIYSANTGRAAVADENGKAKQSDVDFYWQIVDQVMIEYQIGPQPKEADPMRFGDQSAKTKALKKHQKRIGKYDGVAAEYLEYHWRELTGKDADAHFAIADNLQAMDPIHAQYFVNKGKENLSYDDLYPEFHSIISDSDPQFSTVKNYKKAAADFWKASENNRKGAIQASKRTLNSEENKTPTYLFVKQFTPPDFKVITYRERIDMVHAILLERKSPFEAQRAVTNLLSTMPDKEWQLFVIDIQLNEYALFYNLQDFMESQRQELTTLMLRLSFYIVGSDKAQQQITDLMGQFGKKEDDSRFGNNTNLFPYASPGLFRQFADITHSYDINLVDGKSISAKVSSDYAPLSATPLFFLSYFDGYSKEKTFHPFDIVALEVLVPDENQSNTTIPVFMPAIALSLVQDDQFDAQLGKWIDAGLILTGVALTILAPGMGAFWLAADIVFTTWTVASTIINDFRDVIAATSWGPTFLKYWDLADFFINLVGMGLFIYQMPNLAKTIAQMLKAGLPKLKSTSVQTYNKVKEFVKHFDDDILRAEQAGAKQADGLGGATVDELAEAGDDLSGLAKKTEVEDNSSGTSSKKKEIDDKGGLEGDEGATSVKSKEDAQSAISAGEKEAIDELESASELFRKTKVSKKDGGLLFKRNELRKIIQELEERFKDFKLKVEIVDAKPQHKERFKRWDFGNVQGSFAPEPSPKIYIRKNTTELTLQHELWHFEDFKRLGLEEYKKVPNWKHEESVWQKIYSTKSRWTDVELADSYLYYKNVVFREGGNPKIIQEMEQLTNRLLK